MLNPRTNIYDFAMEVCKLRELQKEFFAMRINKLDTRLILSKTKKQEKYVDGVINQIKMDKAQLKQADLFNGNTQQHFDDQLVSGAEMVKLYGQKVEFEWLNNDGTAWVKAGGNVTAVTVRHAELGRVRGLVIGGKQSEIRKEAING